MWKQHNWHQVMPILGTLMVAQRWAGFKDTPLSTHRYLPAPPSASRSAHRAMGRGTGQGKQMGDNSHQGEATGPPPLPSSNRLLGCPHTLTTGCASRDCDASATKHTPQHNGLPLPLSPNTATLRPQRFSVGTFNQGTAEAWPLFELQSAWPRRVVTWRESAGPCLPSSLGPSFTKRRGCSRQPWAQSSNTH